MASYLVSRIIGLIVVFLIVSIVAFLLMHSVPGGPFDEEKSPLPPAGMSLLTTTFPEGPMRNRAFSLYSVFGGSGFSLGLVLSGLLTPLRDHMRMAPPRSAATSGQSW